MTWNCERIIDGSKSQLLFWSFYLIKKYISKFLPNYSNMWIRVNHFGPQTTSQRCDLPIFSPVELLLDWKLANRTSMYFWESICSVPLIWISIWSHIESWNNTNRSLFFPFQYCKGGNVCFLRTALKSSDTRFAGKSINEPSPVSIMH